MKQNKNLYRKFSLHPYQPWKQHQGHVSFGVTYGRNKIDLVFFSWKTFVFSQGHALLEKLTFFFWEGFVYFRPTRPTKIGNGSYFFLAFYNHESIWEIMPCYKCKKYPQGYTRGPTPPIEIMKTTMHLCVLLFFSSEVAWWGWGLDHVLSSDFKAELKGRLWIWRAIIYGGLLLPKTVLVPSALTDGDARR